MAAGTTIHLVRHGQSAANLDAAVNRMVADHAVELSESGYAQARAAGDFLAAVLNDRRGANLAVYLSPYRRTRQTWETISGRLTHHLGSGFVDTLPVRESIFLRELEFGLFDGVPDEDLAREFPREHEHYRKAKAFEGEFYARMPSGESRADVAQRVHQFFGTLQRDVERHGVTDAIIISHGVTIRAFVMMWLGLGVEWFDTQRNPWNCSVRTLEGDKDRGYTFRGFDHARNDSQERREAQPIP